MTTIQPPPVLAALPDDLSPLTLATATTDS
jgi:hypothetical protein